MTRMGGGTAEWFGLLTFFPEVICSHCWRRGVTGSAGVLADLATERVLAGWLPALPRKTSVPKTRDPASASHRGTA